MKLTTLLKPADRNSDGSYTVSCPVCNYGQLWLAADGTLKEQDQCKCNLSEYASEAPDLPTDNGWCAPIPLQANTLPAFPLQRLPKPIKDYVNAVASNTATPPDLAGMLALAVIAIAVAGKYAVCAGWNEPLNAFVLVSMPPGSRKSTVFRLMTQVLDDHERAVNADNRVRIAEAETQLDILKGRLEAAKKVAATSNDQLKRLEAENDANRLSTEIAQFKVPAPLRLSCDDHTPEKLTNLLHEQQGRLAILSPEGGLFDGLAGRYSASMNIDPYLKGHAGDTLRVDRIGRNADYIERPTLTIGLTVQPDVLRGLQAKPGLHGRGLLARFWYSLPPDNIGYLPPRTPSIPDAVAATYAAEMTSLLNLTADLDADGQPCPHRLTLNPAADNDLRDFFAQAQVSMRPDGELFTLRDWGSKLHGAVLRIAGLLHLCRYGDTSRVIGPETMADAIAIGKYLAAHARAAYSEMGTDADTDNARAVLDWLRRKRYQQFSKRDAHNAMQGRFKRAADLDRPLEILSERGYIRPAKVEVEPAAHRPKGPVYDCNPAIQNIQNIQK